jgi:hypothetical protein
VLQSDRESEKPAPRIFATTHWSVVMTAGQDDSTGGAPGFDTLSREAGLVFRAYPEANQNAYNRFHTQGFNGAYWKGGDAMGSNFFTGTVGGEVRWRELCPTSNLPAAGGLRLALYGLRASLYQLAATSLTVLEVAAPIGWIVLGVDTLSRGQLLAPIDLDYITNPANY